MSHESESEAVAADFRDALDDLAGFARAEINNLTLIARENTEHALAISGALQEHIKRVVPQKKLPALYVLDSIVKNVGTPYTIFLSKRLYQTFMDAYASVDMATRRKMDEMLRTWKEPVQGSLDNRPIFPPDVTRPIENALIKARTTMLQAQQEYTRNQQQLLGRGRPMSRGVPYRETPTPPNAHTPQANGYPPTSMPAVNGSSHTNPTPVAQPSYSQHPTHIPPQSRSTPQPTQAQMAYHHPQLGGYGTPQVGISVEALKQDIRGLITASESQLAQSPHEPSIQKRLKALVDLQSILQTQNLPQDQIMLIKNQITDLAVTIRAPQVYPATTPTPLPQSVAVAPPPAATPKVSLDTLFGAGTLAALVARNSVTPQASAPYVHPPPPAAIHTPAQRVEPQKPTMTQPAPPSDPKALMDMLRQAGLLPTSNPVGTSATGPRPPPSKSYPPSLAILGMANNNQPDRPMTIEAFTQDIILRPSSLKQYRPHLLPFLFGSLGPQCTQCGRRFTKDEEGKKRKTAHMDWHFHVNQRIADAEKRGQHRSWLVDEVDWIKTRETIDEDHVAPPGDSNTTSGTFAPKTPKIQYIPVPDDPNLANSVCSICQEKFETRWLDDAQEFVWADAMQTGNKIYHASCYREAFKDGGSTPVYARGTPEPTTGNKRKAEQEELSSTRSRGKVKVEGT